MNVDIKTNKEIIDQINMNDEEFKRKTIKNITTEIDMYKLMKQ
jgi:hypothetical protein